MEIADLVEELIMGVEKEGIGSIEDENSSVYGVLSELEKKGVTLKKREESMPNNGIQTYYDVTLPLSLYDFNSKLLEDEKIKNGEQMYFTPGPIMDLLDAKYLIAGEIIIQEKEGTTIISCEEYGHAFGFMRFYANEF